MSLKEGKREGLMMPKLKGGHGLFETNHDNRYDRVAPVPLPRLLQLSHCALLRVFLPDICSFFLQKNQFSWLIFHS